MALYPMRDPVRPPMDVLRLATRQAGPLGSPPPPDEALVDLLDHATR